VLSAYSCPSFLWSGDEIIFSEEGVQQGDPLGPLLFCLALHEPLQEFQSEFISGYLDDIALGDSVSRVIQDTIRLEQAAERIGLKLNHSKCQVIGLNTISRPVWTVGGLNFEECALNDACLLGSPLTEQGIDAAVLACQVKLQTALPRLHLMSAHEALFLLKNSLAVPKLQFTLRTAPCFIGSGVVSFDMVVRAALSRSLNLAIDDSAWEQASLPVRWGGLGVRSAAALSTSAFLASRAASQELLQIILPSEFLAQPDTYSSEARRLWDMDGGIAPVVTARQHGWDDALCNARALKLRVGATPSSIARLLAGCSEGSGSWLHALPSASIGLRLSNEEARIAAGLRLGAPIVRPHTCRCGQSVLADGVHGLSCKKSAGRHLRHALANDVIARGFRSADTPADLEPTGLLRGDGKRPDGATRIPWSHGKCLVWDFTCPDTLAPSHILHSSTAAGSAAGKAESGKSLKYAALAPTFDFAPVAIETLGAWGPGALALAKDLGSRIASTSGDPRSTFFFRQRLDIAVQRGNAVAVRGTVALDSGTLLDF
jgi:Reverse transcriptase (RNA-dependent DNA polymerase)